MSRIAPVLPLIGGGKTNFQPVYVGDVAQAITAAVEGSAKKGATYELGGPQVASFRECLEMLLKQTGRNKALVSLPWFVAGIMAKATGWLPGAPLTTDQLEMLKTDNVVSAKADKEKRNLQALGIKPTPMAAILRSTGINFFFGSALFNYLCFFYLWVNCGSRNRRGHDYAWRNELYRAYRSTHPRAWSGSTGLERKPLLDTT